MCSHVCVCVHVCVCMYMCMCMCMCMCARTPILLSLDLACWKILVPRLEDFVQFYLGIWLHRRGVYPSHIEDQWSHAAA